MVDQHAAAARDATTIGIEASAAVAGMVLLAAYAGEILSHARESGWRPPLPGVDRWRQADWTSVRLAAVCALARAADPVRPALPLWDPPTAPASG